MSKNMVLDLVLSYKKSSAFISAYELGIFDHMQNKPVCIEELSTALKGDKLLLELLLRYLKSVDLVEEENGHWRLKDEFIVCLKKYGNIIEHEKNLFGKWLLPDYITGSIQAGLEKRQFDLKGFSFNENKTYFKAMNGQNLEIITFWIMRELRGRQDISCLEIGRSLGTLSLLLKNKIPQIDINIVLNKDYLTIYDAQVKEGLQNCNPRVCVMEDFDFSGDYNLICMYNTIHYYPRTEAVELFSRLRNCIKEKAVICIADIYMKNRDDFNSSVILDWITHGGIHNLYIEDLKSIMNETGFRITKLKNIAEISVDLIFGEIL